MGLLRFVVSLLLPRRLDVDVLTLFRVNVAWRIDVVGLFCVDVVALFCVDVAMSIDVAWLFCVDLVLICLVDNLLCCRC